MDNEEIAKRLDEIRYEIEHFDEIEKQLMESGSETYDRYDLNKPISTHELIKLFLPNGRIPVNECDKDEKASKEDGKMAQVNQNCANGIDDMHKQEQLSQEEINRLLGVQE